MGLTNKQERKLLPFTLVFSADVTGLAVIRSLTKTGIQCVVIMDRNDPVMYSHLPKKK